MTLLLATTSAGKIREQRRVLSGLPVELVTLSDLGAGKPSDPEEPGPGFSDNARVKAFYYHAETGLPAIGEDSGLEVDAMNGEPGVHSARWLGKDTAYDVKNRAIIDRLEGKQGDERSARFVSAVAFVHGNELVFETVAYCPGLIADEPSGTGGFGYDPIFYYPELGATLASSSVEDKDRVSHRGRSMLLLRRFLESWLDQTRT